APLWKFLGGGLVNTLKAAVLAVVLSLAVGTLFAVTRISAARWYRWFVVGVDLSLMWYLVIGLTAYNSVVIAEIIRAGVQALPRGQTEAAYAIGLTRGATLRLVLLPQAFRMMLPALIGQLVVVLKDTSLGAFIGYEELLRRGNIGVQNLHNPI